MELERRHSAIIATRFAGLSLVILAIFWLISGLVYSWSLSRFWDIFFIPTVVWSLVWLLSRPFDDPVADQKNLVESNKAMLALAGLAIPLGMFFATLLARNKCGFWEWQGVSTALFSLFGLSYAILLRPALQSPVARYGYFFEELSRGIIVLTLGMTIGLALWGGMIVAFESVPIAFAVLTNIILVVYFYRDPDYYLLSRLKRLISRTREIMKTLGEALLVITIWAIVWLFDCLPSETEFDPEM